MKCVVLAHQALTRDWYNISLATIKDAEWLVHSALCVIDSSQQTNTASSGVLFVKGNFHQIIDYSHIVLIIAIWPGDRIRRPEHPTVEHGSCDESVKYFSGTNFALNHKNTPYIFTVLYLILIHLWNKSTYKIHLLLQVWNEIIADNEHKLGKLGESNFIHMTVNGGGL